MPTLHHTREKGDLGVLKARIDLFEQGITILLPLTEHSPFDLVAYRNGEFRRVQVKYSTVDKYGKIDVKFSTCWTDKRGTHTVPIRKSEVDLYCIYCPDSDDCFYLDAGKFRSNVSLRVETSKNRQQKRIRFAAAFRRVP